MRVFGTAVVLLVAKVAGYGAPTIPLVVAETQRLLVINKPPGVPFHSRSADVGGGDGIMHLVRRAQSEGLIKYRGPLHPVHRLDTGTSGILLLAKDRDAAGRCGRAFQRRGVDCSRAREGPPLVSKHYVALVAKKPTKKRGSVRGDMAPSRRGAWKLLRTTEDPAVTHFEPLGVLPGGGGGGAPTTTTAAAAGAAAAAPVLVGEQAAGPAGPGAPATPPAPTPPARRLVLLRPLTGRTHQLRVALRALGSPILGDGLYGGLSADRLYLHAVGLHLDASALGLAGPGERPADFCFFCAPAEGELWAAPPDSDREEARVLGDLHGRIFTGKELP